MASKFVQVSATGQVVTGTCYVKSAVLAPAAAAASVIFNNGTSLTGTNKNTLTAPANGNSSNWHCGDSDGVYCAAGLYATLSGAGAVATFEVVV